SIRFSEEEKKRDLVLAQKNAQIDKEKTERYALYGGLGLIVVFSIFMVNRFRVTNRQKKIIEEQKLVVEEKQVEVMDSIKYAKRIQDALLKEENHISDHLPEHFVLFKPKDIVSGDFHWMLEKEDFIYLAAADCTGHGVPGAFLTMLGTSYLNEITAHMDKPLPADILNLLRDKFIRELSQHGKEGETKDGMDISLLRLNLKTNQLDWAGANNPLWIIRKEAAEVEEIKADKQPIGYHTNPRPFVSHAVQLKKGDSVYVLSDGYQDQFGGDKGKKFKASNLKSLIFEMRNATMSEQRDRLNQAFENWRSGFEQVDDVCVIGIRI
ncbi:MAG: PP2C family protein-serine/threonine phosphatase, partial [Flavobacteriales bacterium]